MRQSKGISRDNSAALYVRLSRDDNLDGDSYSISNQKKLLTKVAKEKGYKNLFIFCDDGISGVTMNRPDYIKMIKAMELNKVSALFVKDLSRLGRNYIEVGRLTEEFLPDHDIRLVAVSDNIDTYEGESELAPIKNLFNEWYSRDISRKKRISNKIRGNSGEPLSNPPFGYKKNPDNDKRWIIDNEAADIVKLIFDLTLNGVGTHQIADKLAEDRILTPMNYWKSKGLNRGGKYNAEDPYSWNSSTVIRILSTQEYCGDIINFKTYSKSYKNRKRIRNDEENMAIFQNVHEPIIERTVFEKIQEKRGKTRRKLKHNGEKNMFIGLLVCADCKSNLWFHSNQRNPNIKYFNCSGYNKGKRKICSSTHYIRLDFLEQIVLGEIKKLTKFVTKYENNFAQIVMGHSLKVAKEKFARYKRELASLRARDSEIDNLFEHIYEDNVAGKISDERFKKLSTKYESEQREITDKIENLEDKMIKNESQSLSTDTFISIVRKYTRAKKLTARMLNELIDKIEVYQAENIDGKRVQRIAIFYNFVGNIQIPKLDKIPDNHVSLNTRQGVNIEFTS